MNIEISPASGYNTRCGGVSEWSKEAVLKSVSEYPKQSLYVQNRTFVSII